MISLRRLDRAPGADLAPEEPDDDARRGLSLRHELRGQGRATRLAWSPDGSLLAVPSRDRTIRVHDGATGALHAQLSGHTQAVLSACWSPDGRRLASGGYDHELLLWGPFAPDLERQPVLGQEFADGDARCLSRLGGHTREINTVAWSCDGLLASSAEDGQVIVRGSGRDGPTITLLSIAWATHCTWSPDGRQLAVGTQQGHVELWDPVMRTCDRTLDAGGAPVVMLAWSPDGTRLACASKGGGLFLWDPRTARVRHDLRGHGDDVVAVSFSADGKLLASKSRDHTVVLWRTDELWPVALVREQAEPTGWCVGLAFHPRERLLAAAGDEDGVVRLWDLDAGLDTVGRGVLTAPPRSPSVARSSSPRATFADADIRARRRVVLV